MEQKNVVISFQDMGTRKAIEARRGIRRDQKGRIIRTKKWTENRIAFLEEKIKDYQKRLKNLRKELAERKKELS